MRSPHVGGAVLPSISETVSGPLVSVCLPVFNGEKYLKEAVMSVLSQSYRNFELLVFDDASTDGSWDLLNTFDDTRMHSHRNERNQGPEGNWNQALEAATGKYVKLFHQDDLLAPNCLEQQIQALENNPDAVLTFCRRVIIGPDGRRLMTRGGPWPQGLVHPSEVVRRCALAGTNIIGEPSAVLFSANAAQRAGGFDASIPYVIDLDYWVRLLAFGKAYYLDQSLASFRISSHQWSAAIGRKQGHEFAGFLKKLEIGPIALSNPWQRIWGTWVAQMNGLLRVFLYHLVSRKFL